MTVEIPQTGIVFVKFGATWCGPCKVIEKAVEDMKEDIKNRSGHPLETLQYVMIDIDQEEETAKSYDIRAVPTMMLFKDGKNIATKLGAMTKTTLSKWIQETIESHQ